MRGAQVGACKEGITQTGGCPRDLWPLRSSSERRAKAPRQILARLGLCFLWESKSPVCCTWCPVNAQFTMCRRKFEKESWECDWRQGVLSQSRSGSAALSPHRMQQLSLMLPTALVGPFDQRLSPLPDHELHDSRNTWLFTWYFQV